MARTFSRKLSAVVVARCKTADDTLRHLNRGPACCAFSFLEVDSTLVGLAVVVDDEEEEEEEEEDNDDEDDGHDLDSAITAGSPRQLFLEWHRERRQVV